MNKKARRGQKDSHQLEQVLDFSLAGLFCYPLKAEFGHASFDLTQEQKPKFWICQESAGRLRRLHSNLSRQKQRRRHDAPAGAGCHVATVPALAWFFNK